MLDLIEMVNQWSLDRGIPQHTTSMAQGLKTLEEVHEMLMAIEAGDRDGIIDGIGDVIVTLIIQCQTQSLDIEDCLEAAYGQIRDRKGRMENGQFIKD